MQILIGYLNEIDDLEERYCLAMEVGLYVAALDTLVATRDRERVANFINSVPPKCHYEIRGKIDQALRNSVSHTYLLGCRLFSCCRSRELLRTIFFFSVQKLFLFVKGETAS